MTLYGMDGRKSIRIKQPKYRMCEVLSPFFLHAFIPIQTFFVWVVLAEGVPPCGGPRPAAASRQEREAEAG